MHAAERDDGHVRAARHLACVEEPKRRIAGGAACFEYRRQHTCIRAKRTRRHDPFGAVRRRCDEAHRMIAAFRQLPFRPMHPVRAHARRQHGIGRDQQAEPTTACNGGEIACDGVAVFRAKVTKNDGRAARQALGDRGRIGCAYWIGEKVQRRNRGRARIAVEPRRLRR